MRHYHAALPQITSFLGRYERLILLLPIYVAICRGTNGSESVKKTTPTNCGLHTRFILFVIQVADSNCSHDIYY